MEKPKLVAPASLAEVSFEPQIGVFRSPDDWRDQFFYQLLIDRFDNNRRGTPPYDPHSTPHGRDPEEGGKFQGGNLKGIARRLDYIHNLGCTAIWISPPLKQRKDDEHSYHGYAAQDFLDIDPRFGTIEDLQQLVRQAHKRGMYVILDIVLNHSADVWAYKDGEDKPYNGKDRFEFDHWRKIGQGDELTRDDAVWPIELQNPEAYKRRGHIRDLTHASDEEAIDGDFLSLKTFDIKRPEVLDALIKIYKYWIAVADIDGYRIDTVRNMEPSVLARFCNAIEEYASRIGKHNFLIFGEIVGDDDLLHKYIGRNAPAAEAREDYPLFDAVLDFPLYGILDEVIKGEKTCGDLRARYEALRHYYRSIPEAAKYYITFVDNHDQSHRPFRRFQAGHNDPRLTTMTMGYLLCNLGIPCIYYGTEQGFDGQGDSDRYVRESMFGGKWGAFDTTGVQFFDEENAIYKSISAIAKVRAQQPALRYGRQYFREISGNGKDFGCPTTGKCTLAFSRVLDTEEVLVAMNLDTVDHRDFVLVDPLLSPVGSRMIDLLNGGDPHTVGDVPGHGAAIQLPLAARSIAILKKQKQA